MAESVAKSVDLHDDDGWVPEDSFMARLAVVRTRMGWNAAAADRACGFTKNSWQRWEDGRRPQDYEAVCRQIAEVSGCNLNWLMRGGKWESRSRWSALNTLRVIPGGQPEPPLAGQMIPMTLPLFARVAEN